MTDRSSSKCAGGHPALRRRPRGETRGRVLDTAARLFLERGYAGTSIRDIAEELEITKAAVHYHFAAKEQLLAALLLPVMKQYEEMVAGASEPADAREVLLGVRDLLARHGPLLSALTSDPSMAAQHAELHAAVVRLADRTARLLAGPSGAPDRLLRARCALGAMFAGCKAASAGGSGAPVAPADLDVVLGAALAALGPA